MGRGKAEQKDAIWVETQIKPKERAMHIWRKSAPSSGNSNCKDTVTEVGLECLTNSAGASVAGSEWKCDEKQEMRLYLWPDAQPDGVLYMENKECYYKMYSGNYLPEI